MAEVKTCSICNRTRSLNHFHKNKAIKDGYETRCKDCRSQLHREWYQRNKEKRLKQIREYARNNKEKRKRYRKEYYLRNTGKILKQTSEYVAENRVNRNKKLRKRHENRKIDAMKKLHNPPKCMRCPIVDVRVLCIDHIHGGGHQERQNLSSHLLYNKIIKMMDEDARKQYQILCRNCNWIKHLEGLKLQT